MMRRRFFLLGVILAGIAIAGLAPPVRAQALDFHADESTGSVSYAGGSAAMVGTGIGISHVVGHATPLNSGASVNLTGGDLEFTTGAFSTSNATTDFFNGGGTIKITATGTSPSVGAGTTLLSGSFVNATITNLGVAGIAINLSVIFNTIDPALAAYYGLPGGSWPWDGGMNLSVFLDTGSIPGSGGFTADAGSGDVSSSPVPEPGSLALAGMGLVSLVTYRWRRCRKAAV